MLVVAFSRVRRAMVWYLAVLAVILFSVYVFAHNLSIDVNGHSALTRGMNIPLWAMAPIPMFFAAGFASSIGLALNRENATLEIAWTKPIPRYVLAARYIGVDVAAVALAYGLAWIVALLVVKHLGIVLYSDNMLAAVVLLALGVSVMWYALILAITAPLSSRAGAVGGLLWPVAGVMLAVSYASGPLGAIAKVIDLLNPFAYLTGTTSSSAGTQLNSIFELPLESRAAMVWILSALLCAAATMLWARREA